MSLEKEIRVKMNDALKAGDKDSKAVYSVMVQALTNKAKDLRVSELTPDQENEVIIRLVKQNQESIDTCPSDRFDIINKLRFEKKILASYMPKQMDKDEIVSEINKVLEELGIDPDKLTIKDKGRVMKLLMPRVKGKADGGMVNNIFSIVFLHQNNG